MEPRRYTSSAVAYGPGADLWLKNGFTTAGSVNVFFFKKG